MFKSTTEEKLVKWESHFRKEATADHKWQDVLDKMDRMSSKVEELEARNRESMDSEINSRWNRLCSGGELGSLRNEVDSEPASTRSNEIKIIDSYSNQKERDSPRTPQNVSNMKTDSVVTATHILTPHSSQSRNSDDFWNKRSEGKGREGRRSSEDFWSKEPHERSPLEKSEEFYISTGDKKEAYDSKESNDDNNSLKDEDLVDHEVKFSARSKE